MAPATRMRRTRVKVCGITNARDAAVAVAAGADALGVVLAPGPRQVTLAQAAATLAAVPPLVARVGVFVDAEPAFVAEAAVRLRLTAVQFHGAEPPERCASAPAPVIKAFRVGAEPRPEEWDAYRGSVAAVLLDTLVVGRAGGTGRAFEWERCAGVLPRFAPVIVAGGLTPLRVGRAMRALHPFAVDVSSGVEERPGHKDREAVHAFIAAVAAADKEEDV